MQKNFSELDDLDIGKSYTISCTIERIRQTSGPTVFTLNDGTGIFRATSFVKPGERAFPNLENNSFIRLFLYFWFPASQLILPYIVILPSYGYFWQNTDLGFKKGLPKNAVKNTLYIVSGIIGVYLLKNIQAAAFMRAVTDVVLFEQLLKFLVTWGRLLSTAGFAVLFMT